MKITRTEHFDIQRKIVANMTTESWEQIPHVAYVYEADVTDLMTEFKKLRSTGKTKITLNTVLMKAIIEAESGTGDEQPSELQPQAGARRAEDL